jgi:hypothetical protein
VLPITFTFAAASRSVRVASTSRDQGQRPMFSSEASSMAMTAMRSEGVRVVADTPRS